MINNSKVYFASSSSMDKINDNSIDLIITSPPYFNIKDYSKNGKQDLKHSRLNSKDVSNTNNYDKYINDLGKIWKECIRVLKPNGKLCINVPLMPILKKEINTHHNRHIFDINSSIQNQILNDNKNIFLMDLYIWNRTNSSKKLMFGSYPFPGNLYAQNTTEFISIYVKDGKPQNNLKNLERNKSKLTKEEWLEFTKQIWNISIPGKGDLAFGEHSAIMPEEIPYRLIKLFSNINDIVLDPFAGSGTTGKVSLSLGRKFIGFEIYKNYEKIINKKLKEGAKIFNENK